MWIHNIIFITIFNNGHIFEQSHIVCGPPLMDVQEWVDQHELTYSSYVKTRDVTLQTCRRRWMIGRDGERRSGISAQAARHDDDEIIIALSNYNLVQIIYTLLSMSN